jgi:hypothetical protein
MAFELERIREMPLCSHLSVLPARCAGALAGAGPHAQNEAAHQGGIQDTLLPRERRRSSPEESACGATSLRDAAGRHFWPPGVYWNYRSVLLAFIKEFAQVEFPL